MFDECSKCICTYKEEWRCYTRLIDKCSGQDNKKHNKSKICKDFITLLYYDKIDDR